jgi:hypothetical protein
MDSLHDQYGYDDSLFINDPPEYLKCGICQLVLRKPIQILTCGHKYCAVCYQRITNHAQRTDGQGLCPVDREVIPLSEVRDDKAMQRIIGSLQVRCVEFVKGCVWTGELYDLQTHNDKCKHQQPLNANNRENNENDLFRTVNNLKQRMDKSEVLLYEKDKDLSHMNFMLKEMKKDYDLKLTHLEKKVDFLMQRNELLTEEVESLKLKNKLEEEVKQIKEREEISRN